MKKCIVTVLGKDTVGIIARVCTYLAENGINILDISSLALKSRERPVGNIRSCSHSIRN